MLHSHFLRRGLVAVSLCVCAATAWSASPEAPSDAADEPLVQLAQHLAGDLNRRAGVEPTADPTAPAAQPTAPTEPTRAAVESQPLGPAGSDEIDTDPDKTAGDPMGSGWVFQTAGALALVLGLIFVTRSFLRRVTGGVAASGRAGVVDVLSRVSVAPKSHVLVLRTGNRILLVGESPAGLRTLCDITDPEEIAGVLASVSAARPRSISRSFADAVGQFNREYRDEDASDPEDAAADVNELSTDRARGQVTGLLAKLRTIGSGRGGA